MLSKQPNSILVRYRTHFLEVLFKGVRTRDINLDFKFLPRNNQQSKIVAEIIRRLKFHMPEFKYRQSDSSYLYPSTFDITFMKIEGGEAKQTSGYTE